MTPTKIEWCDETWNPVTGCKHPCDYCYARGIARRFAGGGYGKQAGMFIAEYKADMFQPPYDLSEPQFAKTKDGWYRQAPFPFGFEPTLHRYRLGEPARKKQPRNIFVGSMTDLFGAWVPREWNKAVYDACRAAPQHNYLFLTKNPRRYIELGERAELLSAPNIWYGTSITGHEPEKVRTLAELFYNTFLSIEPLLSDVGELHLAGVDWVIIGAETGNRKGKVTPGRAWIENIVAACRAEHVPVFMKDSLAPVWDRELVREFPKRLRKEEPA